MDVTVMAAMSHRVSDVSVAAVPATAPKPPPTAAPITLATVACLILRVASDCGRVLPPDSR